MTTTSTPNATPLMRKTVAKMLREGAVIVTGLDSAYEVDGELFQSMQAAQTYVANHGGEIRLSGSLRSAMRRFLEREAQRPVSMLHLGPKVLYEVQ